MFGTLNFLKGTIFHPQWLSDRFHRNSQRRLDNIQQKVIINIGSGDSKLPLAVKANNYLINLDFPSTNARYQNKPDVYGDACSLPVKDNAVDAVLLLEVLEHVPDEHKALKETVRILKPSGKLYLSVPFLYPLHDAPADYRRFTIHGLRNLLTQQGLSIDTEKHHGNSYLVAMQLFNLALLETARDCYRSNRFCGFIIAVMVYPLCLAVNILALPLVLMKHPSASNFGHFIVAQKSGKLCRNTNQKYVS